MSYSSLGAAPPPPSLTAQEQMAEAQRRFLADSASLRPPPGLFDHGSRTRLSVEEARVWRQTLAAFPAQERRILIKGLAHAGGALVITGLVLVSGAPAWVKVIVTLAGLAWVGVQALGLWMVRRVHNLQVETRGGQSWLVVR